MHVDRAEQRALFRLHRDRGRTDKAVSRPVIPEACRVRNRQNREIIHAPGRGHGRLVDNLFHGHLPVPQKPAQADFASAMIRLDPATDSEGTYMSVQSTKGQTGNGLGPLFSATQGQAPNSAYTPATSQWEAEIGYGFGLPGPGLQAVLTPYAGLSLDGVGQDTLQLGTRYRLGDGVALGVEATTKTSASTVDIVTVNGTLYW